MRVIMNHPYPERIMPCFLRQKPRFYQRTFLPHPHKGVISGFGLYFIKTGIFPREMGRELNRAFGKRQIGDYEFQLLILKGEAAEMLQSGIQFVETIRQYLAGNEFV